MASIIKDLVFFIYNATAQNLISYNNDVLIIVELSIFWRNMTNNKRFGIFYI